MCKLSELLLNFKILRWTENLTIKNIEPKLQRVDFYMNYLNSIYFWYFWKDLFSIHWITRNTESTRLPKTGYNIDTSWKRWLRRIYISYHGSWKRWPMFCSDLKAVYLCQKIIHFYLLKVLANTFPFLLLYSHGFHYSIYFLYSLL